MRSSVVNAVRYSALVLFLCSGSAFAAELPAGSLGVDVTIERLEDGTYLCTAQVSQLATHEIVAAPKIRFRSGEDAAVKVGTQDAEGRQAELKFDVSASESEGTALFRMTAIQGGVETQLHQVRVRLR